MRLAFFDIEATSLTATYGRFLCACFKFQDERTVRTIRARTLRDERTALKEFVKIWGETDIVVSVNGLLFDRRFINGRLLRYGLAPLEPKFHIDLRWIHSEYCATAGHSLDLMSRHLRCKTRKFRVDEETWLQAHDTDNRVLSKTAHDAIVKHCVYDVLTTEEVFSKVKKCIKSIKRR